MLSANAEYDACGRQHPCHVCAAAEMIALRISYMGECVLRASRAVSMNARSEASQGREGHSSVSNIAMIVTSDTSADRYQSTSTGVDSSTAVASRQILFYLCAIPTHAIACVDEILDRMYHTVSYQSCSQRTESCWIQIRPNKTFDYQFQTRGLNRRVEHADNSLWLTPEFNHVQLERDRDS